MARLRQFISEERAPLLLIGLALALLLISCGRGDEPLAPAVQPDLQVSVTTDPCEGGQ